MTWPSAVDRWEPLTAGLDSDLSVAVVGAGAVGLTAAHDLAVGGADVTLFERDGVAAGSTGRAAGLCYDAFAEDVDAAVGTRSLGRFRALDDRSDFTFHETPYVMFAREGDLENVTAIETGVPRMQTHGRDVSLLDPGSLRRAYPVRSADVAVAAIARDAGWGRPRRYAEVVASLGTAAGVTLRTGTSVGLGTDPPSVLRNGRRRSFDAVVVAAGAWTPQLLSDAGVPVPIKAYRAQALLGDSDYDGPMVFDASSHLYFRPDAAGVLVGDGVRPTEADPEDWVRSADSPVVERLQSSFLERTGRRLGVKRSWAGLCTATPDGDPLVGRLDDGIYVAAGWQGSGFMRAPSMGEIVAARVLDIDERLPDPLAGPQDPFAPGRFDGEEAFEIGVGMAPEN